MIQQILDTKCESRSLVYGHQNHPTLYPVPAKWDHLNRSLQLCRYKRIIYSKYNAHW